MRQAPFDLNADSTASRKNRRPALTAAAGLIAVAVAAAVVFAEHGGRTSAGNDRAAHSSVVPLAATQGDSRTAITNTTSAGDAAKPRFERTDEPAYDDSVRPHGG